MVVQLLRGADLLDDAVLHHRDAVADGVGLLLVVGDEDGGQAQLALKAQQLLAHLHAQLGVQVRQRLVQQQHLRLDHDGAGERDALLLAARQLRRPAVGQMLQPDEVERRVHPPLDLRARHAPLLQPEGDVAAHCHMRPQRVALEHHADVALVRRQARDVAPADRHLPALRDVEAGDQAKQRGLAAARRAEEGEELARLDVEVDVLQHAVAAVGQVHAVDADADALHPGGQGGGGELMVHGGGSPQWSWPRSRRPRSMMTCDR